MKRLYVLNSRVMFTPGEEEVRIPVQGADPEREFQEEVVATQSKLAPDGGNWGDEPIREAAKDTLAVKYPGDEIEVITLAEWKPRAEAMAKKRAADKAAAMAEAQSLLAKAAAL